MVLTEALSVISVALALSSLVYAFRVARQASEQVASLSGQTRKLKQETDRISEMAERLSQVALNLGQADYFMLRTLASSNRIRPRFDEHGMLDGYEYDDCHGSAELTFKREGATGQFLDVSLRTFPPERESREPDG